jgi:hypothetical protein
LRNSSSYSAIVRGTCYFPRNIQELAEDYFVSKTNRIFEDVRDMFSS